MRTRGLRFQAVDDVGAHDVDGVFVGAALRDNEIGVALCRFDEFQMHRFQDIKIAVHDHLGCAPALSHIAGDDADETLVGICVNEYLQIHQVTQFLAAEGHDALNDNHVARLDMYRFGHTVALEITICGLLYGVAHSQLVNLLDKQLPVEGVGVVEIDFPALFHWDAVIAVVIGVLRDNSHAGLWQGLNDISHNGCLSRPRASSYADDVHF